MPRLFRILAASSAVLFVLLWAAFFIGWVRGYRRDVTCDVGNAATGWLVTISQGRIQTDGYWRRVIPDDIINAGPASSSEIDGVVMVNPTFAAPTWSQLDCQYFDLDVGTVGLQIITAPCWMVSLLLAIYPLWWGWRWRVRRHRNRRGFDVLRAGETSSTAATPRRGEDD